MRERQQPIHAFGILQVANHARNALDPAYSLTCLVVSPHDWLCDVELGVGREVPESSTWRHESRTLRLTVKRRREEVGRTRDGLAEASWIRGGSR